MRTTYTVKMYIHTKCDPKNINHIFMYIERKRNRFRDKYVFHVFYFICIVIYSYVK